MLNHLAFWECKRGKVDLVWRDHLQPQPQERVCAVEEAERRCGRLVVQLFRIRPLMYAGQKQISC
jgi:hypothetical protein